MKHFLFYVIPLLLMVGCKGSRDVEDLLDRAEMLMAEQPDSAYTILAEIDGAALPNDSELQARYALLLTRSQYKSYHDPESDSLINIAAEYYEAHGSDEEKFYAYLYQGLIQSLLGERRQSSHSLYRALYNSESVDDPYHKGQMFIYLSSLYAGLNNREYLRFARLASQEYANADLLLYYLNAKTKEAIARLRLYDFEGTEALLDSIHEMAFVVNDTTSICDVLSIEANYAVLQGKLETATQIFEQLHNYGYELNNQDMGYLSYLLTKQSRTAEAQDQMSFAQQLLQTKGDSTLYYTHMLVLCKELQDDKNTICYQDSLLTLYHNLYLEEQEHAEFAARCDYLELKQHKENIRNEKIRWYLFFGLFILIFALLLMSAVLKKNRVKARMQKEVIENLRLELTLHQQERADALNLLKTELYTKLLKSRIEEKKGLSHDEQQYIHHLFDEHLPDFQKSLYRLAKLSDTELLVCYLIKAGASPNEIAVLVNRTAQAISQIRTRLYYKVFNKKGKPSDWDTFIYSI